MEGDVPLPRKLKATKLTRTIQNKDRASPTNLLEAADSMVGISERRQAARQ
jgi:hypothetical protein